MVEHTIRLLKECDNGCKMAVASMEQLLEYVEEKKLRDGVLACVRQHKEFEERAWKILSDLKETGKEPKAMEAAWARLATGVKMHGGGDREAARVLTDGCSMGIKALCGFKNQYPGASAAARELAAGLISSEETLREQLKVYL